MPRYPKSILGAIGGFSLLQQRMALILYQINGEDSAMEFIDKIKRDELGDWDARGWPEGTGE